MSHQINHQEILLFTGTSFTNRQFCPADEENKNYSRLSSIEELESACWAGMLCELLPELVGNPAERSGNFIWNILSGKRFLYISTGPSPVAANEETSIDPYLFLPGNYHN
ncbi:MAG: hypothetical protein HC867_01505 [Bacteroidia bacterium]|nr:hypothetical protein [Bacteroidia bacterium]